MRKMRKTPRFNGLDNILNLQRNFEVDFSPKNFRWKFAESQSSKESKNASSSSNLSRRQRLESKKIN